jgi:sodium-dependent dicarboxylate transporter 2/3/5
MMLAGPLALLLLPIVGLQLTRSLPRPGRDADGDGHGAGLGAAELAAERADLGRMSPAERRAAVLFAVTALAWITRSGLEVGPLAVPGWSSLLSTPGAVSDAVPAVAAAILACLVPSGEGPGRHLVEWNDVRHGVPWGVLLLFGGGFAIAGAVGDVGLAGILANGLHGLAGLPLPVMVLVVCLFTTSATELTSNTATATLLMPIMAALAQALHQPPYLLMVPATISASCAFMLPVATPPNAIVMGSGQVRAIDLFREGIWLNLAAAVVTTAVVLTLGRLVLPIG